MVWVRDVKPSTKALPPALLRPSQHDCNRCQQDCLQLDNRCVNADTELANIYSCTKCVQHGLYQVQEAHPASVPEIPK